MLRHLRRRLAAIEPASAAASPASPSPVHLAVATLLFEVARADFDIDPRERAAIRHELGAAYHLGPERAAALTAKAEREADDAISLYEYVQRLNDDLSLPEKVEIMEMLWRVAFVDGRIDKYEEYAVRRAADLLHIPHRRFIRAKLKVAEEPRHARPREAGHAGAPPPTSPRGT